LKAAILANRLNSFYKPLAEGLQRMMGQLGMEAWVEYDGLELMDFVYRPKPLKDGPLHFVSGNLGRWRNKQAQQAFFRRISGCDLLVVVANIPYAFLKDSLSGIEKFRMLRPDVPVVQYSYSYLPLAGKGPLYQETFGEGFGMKAFGLERYDHYLMVTLSSPQPLLGEDHPVSVIGCHLDDGSLYPEQQEFLALIDFPRKGTEKERALQLEVLKETNIPFIELQGSYRIDEIRQIYRRAGAYFLQFQESFGFPICELQACGSKVFSPYRSWLYAHSMKSDPSRPGLGSFTGNFQVYNNDPVMLRDQLLRLRQHHSPEAVRQEFMDAQGSLFRGDSERLQEFIDKLASGRIHGRSHLDHDALNALIDPYDHGEIDR